MRQNNGQNEIQVVIFTLGAQEFALEVFCVYEVLCSQKIYLLPQRLDFLEGVINVRGHILAVMDLGRRFQMESGVEKSRTKIIVCKIQKFILGLMVDSVLEVAVVKRSDKAALPQIISGVFPRNCISGIARWGERVVAIVDLEKLLSEEETVKLAEKARTLKS